MDTYEPPTSESPPAGIEPENQWRTMYAAERKKARILGATTVAASLLAVGAGVWGLTANEVTGQAVGPGTSQFGPPGTAGQDGTAPGQRGPMGQDLSALLFNADGSVNAALLQEFLNRMPGGSGGLQQFLAMAVSNGELTQAQADAIAETIDGAPATGTTAQDT
jgi:hypothetical protein